jgi:hypothetical protein
MMRIHRLVLAAILATIAAGMLAWAASAATFVRMDMNALAHAAQIIVRVRCVASETRWQSGAIWTFTDFDVLETLKGSPAPMLRVRLPGGRVDHVETRVEGVPHFAADDEAVLFLERTSAGDLCITSWAQGTFRVHRTTSGEPRLTQETSTIAVFDPHTRQLITYGARNLPLSEFRHQLAEALHAAQTNK